MKKVAKVLIASPNHQLLSHIQGVVKKCGYSTRIISTAFDMNELDANEYQFVLIDEEFVEFVSEGWIILCRQETADYHRQNGLIPIVKPCLPHDIYRCLGVTPPSLLVGSSEAMVLLRKMVGRLAPHGLPIYIHGETGVGKEVVAMELHNLSGRQGELVVVNCAGFSNELLASELFGHEKGAFTGADREKKGLFEMAHGGTIFLDEVGDMPMQCQAKLLRVLENGTFMRVGGTKQLSSNARVVCATHYSLPQLVREKQFRGDLYQRLNGFTISIPPLRERLGDVPGLVQSFLPGVDFTGEAMQYMQSLRWPGNVRELKQVCQRIEIFREGEVTKGVVKTVTDIDIIANDAPPLPESKGGDNQEVISALANLTATLSSMQAGGPVRTAVGTEKEEGLGNNGVVLRFNGVPTRNDVMRAYFKEVYDLCSGNMKRVAEAMGISRTTLYTMRSELELEE